MPRGNKLTLESWVDKLLDVKADVIRRAIKLLPGYVSLDVLSIELRRRGCMLARSKTHILVIKDSYLVITQ